MVPYSSSDVTQMSGSPEIPNLFEKSLFAPSSHGGYHAPTSAVGVLAKRVKIAYLWASVELDYDRQLYEAILHWIFSGCFCTF